jgi:hypothetical protein
MNLLVYRTIGRCARSVLQAELVAEIETDVFREDPQAFADAQGGDIIESAPLNPEEEEEHG